MQLAAIRGAMISIDITPITISQTKSAPASGAWKTDAIAPAAEHAIKSLSLGVESRSRLPTTDANTATVCTRGPSRPIEVPDPIVIIAARLLSKFARTGIYPLPIETASMYGVGDFFIFFAANNKTIPASNPPAKSENILRHGEI